MDGVTDSQRALIFVVISLMPILCCAGSYCLCHFGCRALSKAGGSQQR